MEKYSGKFQKAFLLSKSSQGGGHLPGQVNGSFDFESRGFVLKQYVNSLSAFTVLSLASPEMKANVACFIWSVTQVKYRYQIRVIVSISFEHDCRKLLIAQ